MIYVDRNTVVEPAVFASEKMAQEILDALLHYQVPEELRTERRFHFRLRKHPIIKRTLSKLFRDKCAYCESRLTSIQPSDITFYRPVDGIISTDDYKPDHYWWLVYEWDNYFLSCIHCNTSRLHGGKGTAKDNYFPIAGKRADLLAGAEELQEERPLLLNPCSIDDHPQDHLIFHRDGKISGATERGKATIDILGLNRATLVAARKAHGLRVIRSVRSLLVSYNRGDTSVVLSEGHQDVRSAVSSRLGRIIDAQSEFAGMSRQLIRTMLRHHLEADSNFVDLRDTLKGTSRIVSESESTRAKVEYREYLERQEKYSLEERDKRDDELYRSRLPRIATVHIHNLKAIRDIEMNLLGNDGEDNSHLLVDDEEELTSPQAPWTMLIGENATGKSTILEAIAMVLLGERYLNHVLSSPGDYVRNRCKSGFIKVQLTGFTKPHTLTFRKNKDRVEFSGPGRAQTLLLGYGSMRLLDGSRKKAFQASYARVDNLFNPTMPLADPNRWLGELRRTKNKKFHRARRALTKILLLGGREQLLYRQGRLQVKLKDTTVPISQLSAGYQSALALASDIMEVVISRWHEPELARGIVLIDEIGAHLHPKWKMRLVTTLRSVLPKAQFIATTHDPLCLRGLNDGEVVLLQRNARNQVIAVDKLPSIKALRVDQLLTSEHFGLSSARDPASDEFFRRYYLLLGKRKRTKKEEVELTELRRDLPLHGLRGATRRERLMLDAIDYYLATEPQRIGTPRARASQEALDKVLGRILSGET